MKQHALLGARNETSKDHISLAGCHVRGCKTSMSGEKQRTLRCTDHIHPSRLALMAKVA